MQTAQWTLGNLSCYAIGTEGQAATDELHTINGGTRDQILILRSAAVARDVTLVETGNLRLAGNFTLDHSQDSIVLMFDGTNWKELSRSDNSA